MKPANTMLLAPIFIFLLLGQGVQAAHNGKQGRKLSQVVDPNVTAPVLVQPAVDPLVPSYIDAQWIDPQTPAAARTIQRCALATPDDAPKSACDDPAAPLATMDLVFSDEFDTPRDLTGNKDPKWNSEDWWCGGTQDMEVYKTEQAVVNGGSLNLIMDLAPNGTTVPSYGGKNEFGPPPLYSYWNVKTDTPADPGLPDPLKPNLKSGQVTTWNKFCFTGGYLEASLTFPGNSEIPGFWPAFWLMGNLGRVCYKWANDGMWPYTYNTCGGEWWKGTMEAQPQLITACPQGPGEVSDFDRMIWGMKPGVARGAPEIDMVEYKVEYVPDVPGDYSSGQFFPQSPITLQTMPNLPNGTTWTGRNKGQLFPTNISKPLGVDTGLTQWKGDFTSDADSVTYRPGNEFQDAVSGFVRFDETAINSSTPYKVGVHWDPIGGYIRWYINDVFVYEVNKDALEAQTNGTATTGDRLIPTEAMYIILNLAMSDTYTQNFISGNLYRQLQFPATYKVDYVRVYQEKEKYNVGCSPKEYPTEQYIACNPEKFVVKGDAEYDLLIKAPCYGNWTCHLDFNKEYVGGTLKSVNATDVKQCCEECQNFAGCTAYSFYPSFESCDLKNDTYTSTAKEDIMSGTVHPPVCTMMNNTLLSGGDLPAATGAGNFTAPATSPLECCKLCKETKDCGAFSFIPSATGATCYLKKETDWVKSTATVAGTISGRIGPNSTLGVCNLKEDVVLDGADLVDTAGNLILAAAANPAQCCQICKEVADCGAFTYTPATAAQNLTCALKAATGWTQLNATVAGAYSGVLGDFGIKDGTNGTCVTKDKVALIGGDIMAPDGNLLSASSDSADRCCSICRRTAKCAAFTYRNATCFLKAATGWKAEAVTTTDAVVSGAISEDIDLEPKAEDVAKCAIEKGVQLMGGDIMLANGNLFAAASDSPEGCCSICKDKADAGCKAFTYDVGNKTCFLKSGGWEKMSNPAWVSGALTSWALRACPTALSLLLLGAIALFN